MENVEGPGADEGRMTRGQLTGDRQDGRHGQSNDGDHAGRNILDKMGLGTGKVGAGGFAAKQAKLECVFQFELLPRGQQERRAGGGDGRQRRWGIGIG